MAILMFLNLDGIEGESTDAGHRHEIELLSYGWGESHMLAGSGVGAGGGGSIGKIEMQDFHFCMHVNQASPKLFLACAAGTHIKRAVLSVRHTGNTQSDFLRWTLSDVLVTSYQTAGEATAKSLPADQISLHFAGIEVEYHPLKPDGSLGTGIQAGWDALANKPV